jgi:hypothetical protein
MPFYLRIFMECNDRMAPIKCVLPPSTAAMRVNPQPKALSMSVEMPRFLLPDRWQIALVQLTLVRPVELLRIDISGLSFKPADLNILGVSKHPENGMYFTNLATGNYEMYLPIKTDSINSGTLRIEAAPDRAETMVHDVSFTVSEFLGVKLVYREKTGVAQLSANVTSACVIDITDVQFYGRQREVLEAEVFGLPMSLGLTKSSALFLLKAVPESAMIFVQQQGLQPFSLRWDMELFDEEAVGEKTMESVAPLTILVPVRFSVW